jgi:cellulose synthase/poly-beta-1,6-N-acetylglucosamine synthase-like glycosyltransferase
VNALDPTLLLDRLDGTTLFAMLWFVLLLDLPRYTLAFLALVLGEPLRRRGASGASRPDSLVSVVIAGHNEAATIRRCVTSLREQTHRRLQIICVDDGSTDGMGRVLRQLRREGLLDSALSTSRRCGKSSALNLGIGRARGDLVVITDCDCTFDRDAIEELIRPFDDPRVGATCANIGARNDTHGVAGGLQGLEYMLSTSLGRRLLDHFGQVSCASGALSCIRRRALDAVGGLDVGPGEDLDLTLRLRNGGWAIRFAERSWCLTDVPSTFAGMLRQRLRWERDALRLRLRKHRYSIDPRDLRGGWGEIFHQFEFLFSHVGLTLAFPLYLAWLIATFGAAAPAVLVLVSLCYVLLDGVAALCALILVDRPGRWALLPYAPLFGPFNAFGMRAIRLVAYAQEWIFDRSYRDGFVPRHVAAKAPWY